MRNNPFLFIAIFATLILLIDAYTYFGIRKLVVDKSKKIKRIVFGLYWSVPFFLIVAIAYFALWGKTIHAENYMPFFHMISGGFILFYVPKLIFDLINILDDLIFNTRRLFHRFSKNNDANTREQITRRKFLTKVGLVVAGIPFLSIIYGIKWGRYDFTVNNFRLKFKNLPHKFNGFRVVQISDFHLGSFGTDTETIKEIVELVNKQEPDILLFTGDFVNNLATEMKPFLSALKGFKAKYGKFSVLGNHDYGEYVRWNSDTEKRENLNNLMSIQKEIGFKLLMNEAQEIVLDDQKIDLLGIENWGLPPFPQYGDLGKALSRANKDSFKILMSHDPTHFQEQVVGKTDIDLTLSGHTHGAQFGVKIPGWRWSPVALRYKYWGGLYSEGNQKINVNTGIGFIGFPGRVGMAPEITVMELYNS